MKATYAYLADGTKLAVMTDTVVELYTSRVGGSIYDTVHNGFDYLGSMVYKTLYSTRTLESTDFGGGRINRTNTGSYEITYFITDHLGSTRVITNNIGEIKEQNDYYPFGMRHSNANLMLSANRYPQSGSIKLIRAFSKLIFCNRSRKSSVFGLKSKRHAAHGSKILDFCRFVT